MKPPKSAQYRDSYTLAGKIMAVAIISKSEPRERERELRAFRDGV